MKEISGHVLKLFVLSCVVPLLCLGNDHEAWDKVTESNGVELFISKKLVKGEQGYKAVFYLETGNIVAPVALLKHFEQYPNWISNIDKAELIKENGPYNWSYKFFVHVAFIKKYGYAQVTLTVNEDTTNVHYKMRPKKLTEEEKQDNNNMLTDFKTDWYFELTQDKKIKVEYYGFVNTYGYLIDWLVQDVFEDSVMSTAQAMQKMIINDVYNSKRFSDIHF